MHIHHLSPFYVFFKFSVTSLNVYNIISLMYLLNIFTKKKSNYNIINVIDI